MKVLVTGHDGYIGTRMVPRLLSAGHEVVGLDTGLFSDCQFGGEVSQIPSLFSDVRDVRPEQLETFDAIIHLAALSNDPLGDLDPELTIDINYGGTMTVARAAKEAGVKRFLYSSSCIVYGKKGDEILDESADFAPVTAYGKSKVLSENHLTSLADDNFSPVFLRNATAYGYSPRLRGDLVVNNLTAYAYASGKVLLKSDGTPWRPLIHVEDISQAFQLALEAPIDKIHNQAFNVCATSESYQIRDVAQIVQECVEGSVVEFAPDAGPDIRNYRVNGDKIAAVLGFSPDWDVRKGVLEVLDSYVKNRLTVEMLHSSNLMRIQHIREQLAAGKLQADLRWTEREAVGV